MKKKINKKKLLQISAFVLLLLLATLVLYSLRSTAEKADFTSYSTGKNGVKALYLLTGEMGFKTERYEKSSRFLPQKTTLVIINPDEDLLNDEAEVRYLKNWVNAGNTLVIAGERDSFINFNIASGMKHTPYGGIESSDIIAGQLGKGRILLLDMAQELTNEHIDVVTYAVSFLKVLNKAGNMRVYFNEYYHGLSDGTPLLLDILGPTGKLVMLQLLLALAAAVIVLWRRFGKPVEVFEIIKREENENLAAISNLYIKSRAEDIVLETYLSGFRAELVRYMGIERDSDDAQIAAAAAYDRLLKSFNIGVLFNECSSFINAVNYNKRRKSDTRKMLQLVEKIEDIRREIK